MGDYLADPAQRRCAYQEQYDTILCRGEDDSGAPLPLPLDLIALSLHDTWSEIRHDSAKSLLKLIDKYRDVLDVSSILSITNNLVLTLKPQRHDNLTTKSSSSSSWQVLHGSLNGLLSLSHYFKFNKNDYYNEIQDDIIDTSLKLLNHSNLLVRESSNKCIISYLIINNNKSDITSNKFLRHLLSIIEKLVTSDLTNDSEISANELHGTLSCIISVIEKIDKTIINKSNEILSIISSCLCHKSSTVRQKASQVLILSLKCLDNTDHLLLFLSDIIISCKSYNLWGKLESALLVCDEYIREIFNGNIIISKHSDNIAFMKLLSCLRKSLFQVLMHSEFEVRRMGSQLLPSLVRASIIFDINNIFDFFNDDDEEMVGSNFIEFRLIVLRNTVIYAWAAEAARTIQHIIEISDGNKDNHLNWALRIKGRLLEEDAKVAFHKFLKTISINSHCIENLLSKSLTFLCTLAEYVTKFILRIQNNNNFNIISCDSIEAILMIWVVIIPHSCNEININHLIRRNGINLNFDSLHYFEKYVKSTIDDMFLIQNLTTLQQEGTKSPTSPTKKFSSVGINNTIQLMSSITDPISSSCGILCCLDAFSCNRWLCETISPILPIIGMSVSDVANYPLTILSLAKLACTWSLNTGSDILWLDRKAGARKALFESVPILAQSLVVKAGENNNLNMIPSAKNKLKLDLSINTCSSRDEFESILLILLKVLLLRSNFLDNHDICRILRGFTIIFTSIKSYVIDDVMLMNSIKDTIQYYDKLFPLPQIQSDISPVFQLDGDSGVNDEFSDWDDEEDELDTSNMSVDLKSTVSINAPAPSEFASSIRDDISSILDSLSICT